MILHYRRCYHRNLKMSERYKFVCGSKYCISDKSIDASLLSWRGLYLKNLKIKAKILKTESLVKKKIAYMKHIKIYSDATWTSYLFQSIWYGKGSNVCISSVWSCTAILKICICVLLFCDKCPYINLHDKETDNQYSDKTPSIRFHIYHIIGVVLLMIEFHWKTINFFTCVNKNHHQTNLQNIH